MKLYCVWFDFAGGGSGESFNIFYSTPEVYSTAQLRQKRINRLRALDEWYDLEYKTFEVELDKPTVAADSLDVWIEEAIYETQHDSDERRNQVVTSVTDLISHGEFDQNLLDQYIEESLAAAYAESEGH